MEAEAVRLLHASGVRDGIRLARSADMRYAGQGSEVTTPIPSGPLTAEHLPVLKQAFHAESVLAAMAPVCHRAVAPYGGWSHYCFGGLDPRTGRRVVGTEILAGGHGARLDKDGIDFLVGPFNINNLPSEPWEAAFPMRVEKLQVAVDSEGAGKFRGSPGIHKEVRFLMDDWTFANLAEKEKHVPPGLAGGGSGMKGSTILVRDGTERLLEGKGTYTGMKHGDLIKVTVGGGAGCGDPLERDVHAVWEDVAVNRCVSIEGARERYGVVITPATLEVDVEESKRLRASMRAPSGS